MTDNPKTEAHKLSDIFGFLYSEEVDALITIAHLLPLNAICINFGAGVGTSALAILEQRPDLAETFTTIDIRESDPEGGLENERNAFKNANIELKHTQVLSDSAEAGRNHNGMIDYIFIDGDHRYERCKADIEAWLPKVKPGGIIVFHDYNPDPWKSVVRAVDEMMVDHKELLHIRTIKAFYKVGGP